MASTNERAPRGKYSWGISYKLREMEPMTVAAVGKGPKRDAIGFSHAATRLGKEFGAKFSIRWYKGVIYAIRFE